MKTKNVVNPVQAYLEGGNRGTGTCFINDRGVEINKGRGLRAEV